MNSNQLLHIIQTKEKITTEFKSSQFQLPRDVFESVTAFLNRNGGHLILGVNNEGVIDGVFEDSVDDIIRNFVTSCNDPNQINPTFYLTPEVFDIEGLKVVYIFIPESSQVHSSKGRIFDRNHEGDFDITGNPHLVSQLYLRKQSTFTENTIYPYLTLDDFDQNLFPKIRVLAKNQRANHPWQEMTNEELLKSAGLWRKDNQDGKEGYTLAAAVLLGKEPTISSILSHYKTDAILRIVDTDRYDDRDDIRCNLINAYSRLNDFVRKHLPDKFYMEGDQRVSLRDKIFREITANLLVHREFTNHFPAKLIIEAEKVVTENGNKPHGAGPIDPSNFSPYPKNPVISRFFKEIGYVEELGSGIRNTNKLLKEYTGKGKPQFIEGDIFRTIIPVKIATLVVEDKVDVSTGVSVKIISPIADAVNEIIDDRVNDRVDDRVDDRVNESR